MFFLFKPFHMDLPQKNGTENQITKIIIVILEVKPEVFMCSINGGKRKGKWSPTKTKLGRYPSPHPSLPSISS